MARSKSEMKRISTMAPLKAPDTVEVDIRKERYFQDQKWGVQNHAPVVWLSILGEEVGEAHKAMLDHFDYQTGMVKDVTELREELVQVGAVAKAFIECLDRGKWK